MGSGLRKEFNMNICKEVYLRMDSEIRRELLSSPGAFKAWFVCVLEEVSAEELYSRAGLREIHGINRNTVYNKRELINKAADEYFVMSAIEHFEN